jgi:hypothetical protein
VCAPAWHGVPRSSLQKRGAESELMLSPWSVLPAGVKWRGGTCTAGVTTGAPC